MGKIMRVVKYRLSDGGVVDTWSGPAEMQQTDERGNPKWEGSPMYPWHKKLGALIGRDKGKPKFKPVMGSPIPLLCVTGRQGALEITEAQWAGLGPIAESNGRLRWLVLEGKLFANISRPIFTNEDGPVDVAPATNKAVLNVDISKLGVR